MRPILADSCPGSPLDWTGVEWMVLVMRAVRLIVNCGITLTWSGYQRGREGGREGLCK